MKKLKELESYLLLELVVLTGLLLACGHVFSSDWNELVFREDFDFPSGGIGINTNMMTERMRVCHRLLILTIIDIHRCEVSQ